MPLRCRTSSGDLWCADVPVINRQYWLDETAVRLKRAGVRVTVIGIVIITVIKLVSIGGDVVVAETDCVRCVVDNWLIFFAHLNRQLMVSGTMGDL